MQRLRLTSFECRCGKGEVDQVQYNYSSDSASRVYGDAFAQRSDRNWQVGRNVLISDWQEHLKLVALFQHQNNDTSSVHDPSLFHQSSMASIVPAVRAYCARASLRALRPSSRAFTTGTRLQNQGPGTGENREQANDPLPRKTTPNVSATNETGVTAMGNRDGVLQESTDAAEKQRTMQAPNRDRPWSRNQQAREVAMSGPRFEQTIMELQVRECERNVGLD